MKNSQKPELYVALVHFPVVNKRGDEVASAVTNLDLHDIARASKTFGVDGYYVVTPLSDQKTLVEQITSHWTSGRGGELNPARKKALELIRMVDSIEDIYKDFPATDADGDGGKNLRVIVTSAKSGPNVTTYKQMKEIIKDGKPSLIIFGTAWGLAPAVLEDADYVLEPILGAEDYNHLSVRSAASITLDRLTCPD